MHVTYAPADGDRQEWDVDPDRIPASKGEMIERRFGENFDAWGAAVQSGGMRARRVLLWHLLTLQHPSLRYEDTPDFLAGEVKVQFSTVELAKIRDRIGKASMPEDKRENVLSAIDVEMTEAMDREQGQGSDLGKAESGT